MEHSQMPVATPPVGNGKSRTTLVVAMLALVALFVFGMVPRWRNRAQLGEAVQSASTSAPQVTTVTPHALPADALTLPGSMQAIEETTINARASGYLRRRYVDIGSKVKTGQILAEIESPEVDQQVAQAQADALKSVAGAGQSRAEVQRLQASIAQAQSDTARLQAGVSQAQSETARLRAGVEQAKAELARSQSRLAQSRAALSVAKAKTAQTRQVLEGRRADLVQNQARLDIAQKTYRRYQQLGKQGAVAPQDVDERESAVNVTQANVQAAQAAISSAQADVEAAQQNEAAGQSDIEAAQAGVESSRQSVQAARSAVLSGLSTVQAAQQAVRSGQSSVLAARASRQAAEQNVQAAQATIGSSNANTRRYTTLQGFERITAPFPGVITARNVDTGALVTTSSTTSGSNTALFSIARADILRIQVNVPQTFVASIKAGQDATILVREFPGQTFVGKVFQTAGALDPASRTLLTEVHIPNKDGKLLPGMYAQVQFAAPAATVLRVPAAALLIDADSTRAATVTPDGKVHWVTLTLGRDYGKELEIIGGLKGTEALILNPTDDLKEGQVVSAKAAPAPPPPGK